MALTIPFLYTSVENLYLGANPARPAKHGDLHCLLMDDTTDQFAEFLPYLPTNYGGNGLTIVSYSSMVSATSGNVADEWAVSSGTPGTDNLGTKAFATAQSSGAVAVPGTAGVWFAVTTTLSNSQIDGLLLGEVFKLRLNNDAGVTSGATGDRRFYGFTLKET